MTRATDQAVPAVAYETHDLPYWWAGHGQIVVALERLPQSAYVWDDDDPEVTWDATREELNAPTGGRVATNYVPPVGATLRTVADPPVTAAYWRQTGATALIGVNSAGTASPHPIRSMALWVRPGPGLPETLAWRFDAEDHPGGTPGSYVDPRGRTWIVTPAATAITANPLVWDAPAIGSGFTDVWCDLVSLELVTGEPDNDESYRTPYARLIVRDPGDGRYRARTADGRLLYWTVGKRLAVWWHDEDGADWWLFSGQVATWRDELLSPDVTIEAYGSLGTLAQPIGRDWSVGSPGQLMAQRATAILSWVGYTGPYRSDLGDVGLSVPAASDTPPLDELRRVARSDGGIVYADADDTVVLRDRRWRSGRSDQTTVPTITANVCDAAPDAVVLWDPVAADLDLRLASVVSLSNDAPTPLVAVASNPDVPGGLIVTHPTPDLWTTQAEGNALAAHMAANRADARLALGNADVYLHDIRSDYWHQILDRRLGDRVRFVHDDRYPDDPAASPYDVTLIVTTLRHTITRDTFVVSLATSPAVAYTLVELWDQTVLTWDDPSPLAVWR